ncbi:MAG: hypothetical protein ACOWWH_14040 [Eubacteriaceae bacterium]
MTHNLHRYGTKENLKNDFTVLLQPAKEVNTEGAITKRKRFFEIAFKYKINNAGGTDIGCLSDNSKEKLINKVAKDDRACTICLTDPEDLKNLLIDLKNENLGLSVVVQGLEEDAQKYIEEAGLKIHTTNHSLGIMGNTKKLPNKEILEITTMCGHGLISKKLIEKCIKEVSLGKITPDEASNILAKPCRCGIFNKERASKLISKFIKS